MKNLLGLFIPVIMLFISAVAGSCSGNAVKPTVQHDTIAAENRMFAKPDSLINDGEYIRYYKNGVIQMRGMMKNGKREGLWKSWYENGLPWSETTFREGLKEGMTTTWYDNNNKRYQGFYSKNRESGKWTFFGEDGKVISTKDYDAESPEK